MTNFDRTAWDADIAAAAASPVQLGMARLILEMEADFRRLADLYDDGELGERAYRIVMDRLDAIDGPSAS